MWYKYSNAWKGTYYSPFTRNRSKLEYFKNSQELVEACNKHNQTFDVRTENIAEFYSKNETDLTPQELPCGVYSHKGETSATPEALFPMTIRNDGYVPIIKELDELKNQIEAFKKNKDLYDNCKSIYKYGILLFGPPGTGKTSFMRQFIKDNEDAIIIFLDGVPSRAFTEKLESSTKNKLKIFIFEEVVAMLEDSFDIRHTLDFLDGSTTVSNSIYFMSTNYPESIPENVIRNGRIDTFVRVEFPSEEARKSLIKLYLDREATEDEIEVTKNLPIVDIREICFSHKKYNKSFKDCIKSIEEKAKMVKNYFGKTTKIRL
jgi:SpoVK/Ycf46/Vps4 family AAA+-type ATPase